MAVYAGVVGGLEGGGRFAEVPCRCRGRGVSGTMAQRRCESRRSSWTQKTCPRAARVRGGAGEGGGWSVDGVEDGGVVQVKVKIGGENRCSSARQVKQHHALRRLDEDRVERTE